MKHPFKKGSGAVGEKSNFSCDDKDQLIRLGLKMGKISKEKIKIGQILFFFLNYDK